MAACHPRVKITSQHCLSLLVCQDWLSRKKCVLLTTFISCYFLEVGLLGIAFQVLFTILISCSQNGFTLMKCFVFFFLYAVVVVHRHCAGSGKGKTSGGLKWP